MALLICRRIFGAASVLREGRAQVALVEVGPELVHEDELCVGELPEQEVRDAQLAARSDQQIGVGKLWCVEIRCEDVLVDLLGVDAALDDPPGRLDQLGAAAVVERDPQVDARVQLGAVLHRVHAPAQLLGGAVAAADEAHAHSLLGEIGQLALDRLGEDLHQRVDLVLRARPVLGREREHRQVVDAEIDRRLDDDPNRARAGAMAGGGRKPATLCPAAVAVEDDRDRPGDLG